MSRTKKFKMTDLGPIPEDWEVKRLGDCWNRFSTGPFGSALHATDYVVGGTPLVNPMHIVDGKIVPDSKNAVGELTLKRLSSHMLKKGDLVLGRRGEMGRVAVVSHVEDGWLCGTGSFAITLKKDESPEYVARYLRTPRAVSDLEQSAIGTTMTSLNQSTTAAISIAYPPLPEQRRIAAALSDADELIAALMELLEKKRNLKQGAMQQLLTGKRRLPGFKGKWVEKNIGSLCKICNGRDYKHLSPGDIPVYGTGGEMARVSDWLYDGETVCIGRKGTIDQPQYHAGKIWTVDTLFYTTQFVGVIPKWLFYKFLLVDWNSYNAASGVPSLTSKNIEQIELRVPSDIDEQRAIAEVLTDMDEEIAGIEAELEKAKNVKTGMMQQLLTGKVRLEVA